MKKAFLILVSIFIIQSSNCQLIELNKETVIDNISHLEDSIHYHIDSLSRLCDVLGMKKQFINILKVILKKLKPNSEKAKYL